MAALQTYWKKRDFGKTARKKATDYRQGNAPAKHKVAVERSVKAKLKKAYPAP